MTFRIYVLLLNTWCNVHSFLVTHSLLLTRQSSSWSQTSLLAMFDPITMCVILSQVWPDSFPWLTALTSLSAPPCLQNNHTNLQSKPIRPIPCQICSSLHVSFPKQFFECGPAVSWLLDICPHLTSSPQCIRMEGHQHNFFLAVEQFVFYFFGTNWTQGWT